MDGQYYNEPYIGQVSHKVAIRYQRLSEFFFFSAELELDGPNWEFYDKTGLFKLKFAPEFKFKKKKLELKLGTPNSFV